jgi:hypothetical protein
LLEGLFAFGTFLGLPIVFGFAAGGGGGGEVGFAAGGGGGGEVGFAAGGGGGGEVGFAAGGGGGGLLSATVINPWKGVLPLNKSGVSRYYYAGYFKRECIGIG